MYNPSHFYLLRTPIFPVSFFFDYLYSKEDILEFIPKQKYYNQFKEALLLSSKSLYDSLILFEKNKLKDLKRIEQLKSGILKYFSRATTRATPFGFFASVKFVKFIKENEDKFNNNYKKNNFIKSIRPDMEWLYEIIRKVENKPNLFSTLNILFNPSAYICGNRLLLPTTSKSVIKSKNSLIANQDISIKNNSLTNYCFLNLVRWKKYSDFISEIKNKFNVNNIYDIENFIKNLIDNGFIITEFQPNLIEKDIFASFINKLDKFESHSDLINTFATIKNKIEHYSSIEIGNGIKELEEIYDIMFKLQLSKNPLQIDIANNNIELNLSKKTALEIAKAAEFLLWLSPRKHGFLNIREYHTEFIDKYGTAKEVPILELLDQEIGLGAPAEYLMPKSSRIMKQNIKFDERKYQLFFDKIIQSSFDKKDFIKIEKNDIEQYKIDEFDYKLSPDSIEIYAHIYEINKKKDKKIVLSTNHGTNGACQTFGRFSDLFTKIEKDEIKNLIAEIEKRYPDKIFCELVYMPSGSRNANVAITESYWSYKLLIDNYIDEENLIEIKDVVVCADLNRFYFKSIKHQKEIIFVSSHVLNHQKAPNIIRFMRDISYENCTPWVIFSLGELSKLTYIPRIEYSNIIISPQTWKINKYSLNLDNSNFFDEFYKWKNKWRVPDLVNLVEGDNKILLNLQDSFHLKELMKEFMKNKNITIQENFYNNKDCFAQDAYVNEVVIPFLSQYYDKDKKIFINSNKQLIKTSTIYFPGSNWFYSKLFINEKREEEFIENYLLPFIQKCELDIDNDHWFFIRYRENKKHIRLRIYLKDLNKYSKLLSDFNDFCNKLKILGLLHNSSIDSYEPEIERYGGPDLIELAEKIFMFDSLLVTSIIKNRKYIETEFSLVLVSSFCIISILESFGLKYIEQLSYISNITNKEQFIDEFRENRKKVSTLFLKNNLKWYQENIFNEIIDPLIKRNKMIVIFSNLLNQRIKENKLYNSKEGIIGSFIHMQCNRIFGLNSELEKKSISFALHSLYSINYHFRKNEIH